MYTETEANVVGSLTIPPTGDKSSPNVAVLYSMQLANNECIKPVEDYGDGKTAKTSTIGSIIQKVEISTTDTYSLEPNL